MFRKKPSSPRAIGIDLGTANTIVVASGADFLFNQPSVCCFQAYDAVPRFIAAGTEAKRYVGKVAKPLKIVRPLRNGVLSDMRAARELLQFVRTSIEPNRRFGKIQPHIGIPSDATQNERRALAAAAVDAGFGVPVLVPEPLLAAIGLGLDVAAARGRMVVDCGAGTTEVAIISLGGICLSKSLRGGSEALDQALIDHLTFERRFQIGVAAAEALKSQLSDVLADGDYSRIVEVRGLDTASGLPCLLAIPASELLPVWLKQVDQIVKIVRDALRETPPEMSRDIMEDGISLTGGGAVSALLADRIVEMTGLSTRIAGRPQHCVALGLAEMIEQRNGTPHF